MVFMTKQFLDASHRDRAAGSEMSIKEEILFADRFLDDVQAVQRTIFQFRFTWELCVAVEAATCFVDNVEN